MAASQFTSKLSQDIRYAARQMRRAPGFALVTVLTLALGVGAAAAVFSVMDAVLIRPLPFDHPERILLNTTRAMPLGYQQPLSGPDFQDLRNSMSTTLEAFAGYDTGSASLQLPSGPLPVSVVTGSDNLFRVFDVQPLLGRTFLQGEDVAGRNDVAVLSYEVWQTQFAGDTGVVGRSVRLDGRPTVVIGVMPAGFRFPLSMRDAIYIPLHNEAKSWAVKRGSHWMRSIARTRPGVTQAQALAELSSRLNALAKAYPDTDSNKRAEYTSVARASLGDTRQALWALVAAVAALLLIACVNVAGLLLARAVKREREMALRAAVGATRTRMLRQILTEGVLLGALSSAVGVAFAFGLLALMQSYLITSLSRGGEVHVNGAVLLAAVALAMVTAVGASLLPALRLARLDPNRVLKAGGSAGTGRGRGRLRAGFIVLQVTLSLSLLVMAGLLLQVLDRTRSVQLGFDPSHLLTAELTLPRGAYEQRDPVSTFYTPLLQKLEHTPGVQAAGVINLLPVQEWGSNLDTHIFGHPADPPNMEPLSEYRLVSEGYYRALGVPLTAGRTFSASLDSNFGNAPVIVVNRTFEQRFFKAGESVLDARIDDDADPAKKSRIIGIVGDVRQSLFQPEMAELAWLIDGIPMKERISNLGTMHLVVRTAGRPQDMIPAVSRVLAAVDPTVPLRKPEPMEAIVDDQLVFQRMESWLFGIFAALAVLLAMAGLYGLVSQEVESGTRDTGVRMALGATRAHVLLRVLRRMAALVGTGAAAGVLLTVAARQLLRSVVVMQPGRDAPLLVGLALAMTLLALLVALIPARRAASIEPVQALRAE